jgi:hypothetical protein
VNIEQHLKLIESRAKKDPTLAEMFSISWLVETVRELKKALEILGVDPDTVSVHKKK